MARAKNERDGVAQAPEPAVTAAGYVKRRIVRSYTIALLLIAGAATGTFLTSQAVISEQGASAGLINISGRQRMLSQRISLQVVQLTQAKMHGTQRRLREGIVGDLRTFTESHATIIERSGGQEGMSEALRRLYFEDDDAVDSAVRAYARDVNAILRQPADDSRIDAASRLAEGAKTSLLTGLNTVVFQYQAEAEARIEVLDRVEKSIYLITLLGLLIEVLFIFRPLVKEIGSRTRELEEMTHRASHDELTGLPNRRYFYEQATATLARGTRKGQYTGLLHIDLDGFKAVNDGLGHAAGDDVLRHVTGLLDAAGRRGDFAARLGGDEFVILVGDVKAREDLEAMATRLLAQLEAPVPVQGTHVNIGASVGLAMVPPGARSVDAVLYESDQALYKAKADGKASWKWFGEHPMNAG